MSAANTLAIVLALSVQGSGRGYTPMDLPEPAAEVTIANQHGGGVTAHAQRVIAYDVAGTQVRLLGSCVSACTLILALPPDRICVGPQASLGFHLPSTSAHRTLGIEDLGRAMEESYPRFVQTWLDAKGGLPAAGSNAAIRFMGYDVLKSHYRTCG